MRYLTQGRVTPDGRHLLLTVRDPAGLPVPNHRPVAPRVRRLSPRDLRLQRGHGRARLRFMRP